MNQKGEAGRILIYALTAVVSIVTLIFGYRALVGITSHSEQIMIMDFRTELTRDIDLASSFGAVHSKTYHLPGDVKELCLIDRTASDAQRDLNEIAYPLVADSWKSNAKENVFLLPRYDQFAVETIHFAKRGSGSGESRAVHHLCVPVRGSIALRFFGEGNATRVERDE